MESEYKVEYYDPDTKIFGKTYGQWTTEWWRWLLSTPTEINPLVDETGQHAFVNQPSSNVWFLAGSFPRMERNYPIRKCHVPGGRSILFPIINCEANRLEYPKLKYDSELIEHVENDMNTIVMKDCFVEGTQVIPTRVPSDPKIFQLTISKDNPFGVKGGGTTSATADGYWVFLKPLRNGHYALNFNGSCELGSLNSGASYELEVF
jgi:hypothetical protein